ncbi:MAG: glycosyltransferase N-terminal domain-containing protein [Thermodesulfobacteriota bacterium]
MQEPVYIRLIFALYRLLWTCITPFLLRSPRLREGASERTLREVNFSRVDIWMHAASVGEAFIARQIVASLDSPERLDILITTNTSQGREILLKDLEKEGHRITVTYMVFDNPSLVRKAMAVADPQLLILIELEIWPALLAEIKRRNKKTLIVNGRMTERSFRGYRKTAFLWKRLAPDVILAISEADRKRFQELFQGEETHQVSNIKFDRMDRCQVVEKPAGPGKLLVLASIRKEEEEEVLFLITESLKIFPELRIDLFPRHLHRVKSWEKLLAGKEISCGKKTANPAEGSCSVLIWDVFGELTRGYQRADAVFVGGSLAPLGGQNFIEAFMNGVVPVTGPHLSNFLWAGKEVFQQGLVRKGESKEEVLQLLTDSLRNPGERESIRRKADNYIRSKQGGSRKTCQYIVKLLQMSESNH